MKKWLLILALSFILPINANAMTGSELKKYLIEFNSSSTSPWGPYGVGYVLGVADAMSSIYICAPSVTNKELTSVVLAYLFGNSDKLDKSADILVVRALSAKWPCEKKEGASTSAPAPRPAPKPMPKSESPF